MEDCLLIAVSRKEMSTPDRQKWGIVCGLVTAGLALSVSIAAAAEIKSVNLKDDSVEISVSGTIASGDADLVAARIKSATDAGKLVTSVRLNSDGGNLLEGVRLAALVRSAKLSTNVGQNATCASACFLVFAAGDTNPRMFTPALECMVPPRKATNLAKQPWRWRVSQKN